jgi:fatty acid desaturase
MKEKKEQTQGEIIVPQTPFEHFIVDFFKWGTVAVILAIFAGILYAAFLFAGFYGPAAVIIVFFVYFWMKFDGDRHAQH